MATMNDTKTKKVLTATAVKQARPGSTLTDTHPNEGLRLNVSPKGLKTWVYRFRAPSTKALQQIRLGHFPATSLEDARGALRDAKALRLNGLNPATQKKAQRAQRAADESQAALKCDYTVAHLVEHYLVERIEPARKRSKEARRMLTKALQLNGLGDVVAAGLRHTRAQAWVDAMRPTPRLQRMCVQELKSAWAHSVKRERVPDGTNPFSQIDGLAKAKQRKRALTDAELARWLNWLPDSGMSMEIQDALLLTLLTGSRSGEVIAARWHEIDLAAREWRLSSTKNGLPHTVFLSKRVVEVLTRRYGLSPTWVFPSATTGTHIKQRAIVWSVCEHRDGSDLAHWTAHDLRRTFATGAARARVPRQVIDRCLNHADTTVSGGYDSHGYDEEACAWWGDWAAHLDNLTESNVVPMVRPA